VTQAEPPGRDRARNLLWAAGKLADHGIGLGLAPVPEVLLHPSVIERFTAHAPGLTDVTRRTLRTNLRFIARKVTPAHHPADLPLPRERAKAPYTPAQIDGYLALVGAQPTAARRMRAAGLVCLGAGQWRRSRIHPHRRQQRPDRRHLLSRLKGPAAWLCPSADASVPDAQSRAGPFGIGTGGVGLGSILVRNSRSARWLGSRFRPWGTCGWSLKSCPTLARRGDPRDISADSD
jgi:hypothetical protein